MATKIQHGGGIYSKTLKRTLAGKPIEVFYGRVYIKAEGKSRYFRLGTTLKAAQTKMHKILGDPEAALAGREQARQERRAAPQLTFDKAVELFRRKYRGKKGSRGDSSYYEDVSGKWIDFFGAIAFEKITPSRVGDFRIKLEEEGYGPSSVRKFLTALSTFFIWARREGLVDSNPVADIPRPQEPDREVEVLSGGETERLLAAALPEDRIRYELFMESGMRLGGVDHSPEGLGLRWGRVDWSENAIKIDNTTKNRRARTIPLNAKLTVILRRATKHLRSDILRRDIEAGRAPTAFVMSDSDGNRVDARRFLERLENALERAKISKGKGAKALLFRHTFGSRLIQQGVTDVAVAAIMGNTPEVVRKHYLRFDPSYLQAAMARLDGPGTVAQDEASQNADVNSGVIDSPQSVDVIDVI